MFAEVYPLIRLPRRFTSFTYRLSQEFANNVCVGDLVEISWRSRLVRGVVAGLTEGATSRMTKPIQKHLGRFLNPEELRLYEEVAEETFQSPSAILLGAFVAPSKSSTAVEAPKPLSVHLLRKEASYIRTALASASPSFIQTTDLIETALLAAGLYKKRRAPVLLLLPHAHDVELAARFLAALVPGVRGYGHGNAGGRAVLAKGWRSGNVPLLVGTRSSALLPTPQVMGGVLVGRSATPEHAQYDRNPRYDARLLARRMANMRRAPFVSSGALPTVWDLYATAGFTKSPFLSETFVSSVVVRLHPSLQEHPLLSETLLHELKRLCSLKKSAWLILNRKGIAKAIRCRLCQFTERCAVCEKSLTVYDAHLWCAHCKRATIRPARCRRCQGPLRLVAEGLSSLAKELKRRFKDTPVSVVEKGGRPSASFLGILLTTDYFADNVLTSSYRADLVVLVSADEEIRKSPARVCEYAGHAFRFRAPLLLQAKDVDLVQLWVQDPFEHVLHERDAREALHAPPYQKEVRLRAAASSHAEIEKTVKVLTEEFPTLLALPLPDHTFRLGPVTKDVALRLQSVPDSIIVEPVFL